MRTEWSHAGEGERWASWTALTICVLLHLILWPFLSHNLALSSHAHAKPTAVKYVPKQSQIYQSFVEVTEETASKDAPKNAQFFAAHNQSAMQEKATPKAHSSDPYSEGRDRDSVKLHRSALSEAAHEARQLDGNKVADNVKAARPENSQRLVQPTPKLTQATTYDSGKQAVDHTKSNAEVNEIHRSVAQQARPKVAPETIYSSAERAGEGDASLPTGSLSVNAQFSHFGAYSQQIFAKISHQWYALLSTMAYMLAQEFGHTVHVKFTLRSNGNIANVELVATDATPPAISACTQAIKLSDLPPWSPEMVAMLGNSTPVEVYFRYY